MDVNVNVNENSKVKMNGGLIMEKGQPLSRRKAPAKPTAPAMIKGSQLVLGEGALGVGDFFGDLGIPLL